MSEIELMVFLIRARRYQGIHAHCRGQDGQLVGFCWTRLDVPWQGPRLWWVNPINLRLVKLFCLVFEEDKSLDDTANEIPKEEETSRFAKGLKRPKRQYGDAEQLEGNRDPKMDELHSIWQGVWGAMVDGAEKFFSVIKKKMAGGQNPGQQQYSDA